MKALAEIVEDLAQPFSSKVLSWKPQTITKDKKRALAVPYINARDVMDRLDQVMGPFNWQVEHKEVAGRPVTGVGIRSPENGDWIWKWDAGFVATGTSDEDQEKSVKGTCSDGLKRAGVMWGIGRYLHALPKSWVDYDDARRELRSIPALPDWALPESERRQKAPDQQVSAVSTRHVSQPMRVAAQPLGFRPPVAKDGKVEQPH
jgi:hypothetical protein